MAVSCCRQWCFIRLCKSLQHPLFQSRRKFTSFLLSRLGKIHLIKSTLLIQVTLIFKSFHSFSPLLQEVSVLLPSAHVLFYFWTWFSVSLHVTPFVWNSLESILKFSCFTWPLNSSSLLSAPTFTLNPQVHLSKLH